MQPNLKDEYLLGMQAVGASPKSIEAYRRILKLIPDRPSRQDVLQVIAQQGAPASKAQALAIIRRWCNWHGIQPNPCQGIKLKYDVKHRRIRYLDEGEITKLLEAAVRVRPVLYSLIVVFINTGLRARALCNLSWNDVDMTRRFIRYKRKGSGTGTVPINDVAYKEMVKIKAEHDKDGAVDKVFRLSYTRTYELFKIACELAGLDREITLHTLRHTTASLLIQQGVSLYRVSKILGHANPQTTAIYAHLKEEAEAEALNLIKI